MLSLKGRFTIANLAFLAVLVTAVVFALSLYPRTANATTGINQELSFEGKIVNSSGTNITDGNYNVEFQILNGASCNPSTGSGCSAVWTEDYLTSNTTYATTVPVAFTSGTYQVNLGSICAFTTSSCEGNSNTAVNWNTYPLYLSINLGTTAVCAAGFGSCGGGTGVMYPLIPLTSSPYSFNSNELGGLTSSQYGQIAANNIFTGNNTIQPTANTATALQLENTDGEAIFQGGTSAPTNYIADSDFALGSGACPLTDWSKVGLPTTCTQNTTPGDTYEGSTSLELVTTTSAGQGASTGSFTASPTTASSGATNTDHYYTVSFEAMQTTGSTPLAGSNLEAVATGGGSPTNTCTVSGSASNTLLTSGFEQVVCTLTFTASGSISNLAIEDTGGGLTADTVYIDDVQLQVGSTTSAYQEGTLDLRGVISNPVALQGVSNSTTALQVQNATGNNVLAVDTLNGQLDLGSSSNINGSIVFNNNSNGNAVTLNSGTTSGSYSLTLPTGAPSTSQCLESGSSTASQLAFVTCSGGSSTLQQAYNASAGATPNIDVTGTGGTNYGAVTIQNDFSHPITTTGNLFAVNASASSGLGSNLFAVNSYGDASINTSDTTGTGLTVTGSSITSGNVASFTTSTANALTSGNLVSIASQSNVQSGSGSLLNVSDTATLSTNSGTVTANLVNVSRSLTANITGGTPIVDAAGTGPETLDIPISAPPFTTSYTVSSSHSNLFLLAGILMDAASCSVYSSYTASYNSVNMTLIGSANMTVDGNPGCELLFGKAGPSTGSNTFKFTGSPDNVFGQIVLSDWYNVNQTTPFNASGNGSFTSNSGTVSTASVAASSVPGQIMVDMMNEGSNASGTPSVGGSQTQLSELNDNTSNDLEIGSSSEPAASSGNTTNMSWTGISQWNGAYDWGEVSIGINPITETETVSSPVASISSNCSITAGVCADGTNVLQLTQNYSQSTGAVLSIQDSSTGDLLDLSSGGTPTVVAKISTNGAATFEDDASGGTTTAFQVQNSVGQDILDVDTTNNYVELGPAFSSVTRVVPLQLDNGTSGSDPATEVNGAIYYNSNTGEFRCGAAGAWVDCVGGLLASTNTAPSANASCTSACNSLISASLPANYMTLGRVVTISLWGEWKANNTAQGQQIGVYYGTSATRTSDTLIGTLPTALSVSNAGGLEFHLQFQINCLSTGSSGTISDNGMVTYSANATTIDPYSLYTAGTQTYNTTTAENIYVFPIWTTSNANNMFEDFTGFINGN